MIESERQELLGTATLLFMTLPPKLHDEVHKKWRDWLEAIDPHVTNLFHDREIWREVRDALLADTEATSDTFLASYTRQYVGSSAMAVRRLADPNAKDNDSHSIGALIDDIGKQPGVMTRERWVSRDREPDPRPGADEELRKLLARNFDKTFGDGSGGLDPGKVAADLATLKARSEAVAAFASRTVAHIDRRGMEELPTFDDLDKAIDVVGEMYKRYFLLIDGASLLEVAPVIQHDWKAPLRRPIFEPVRR